MPEQNISRQKRKRCTVTLVQVGPEPQRKELEEVKEQLRAHNNRWQEKKSDDQLKRVDIDYPAPLEPFPKVAINDVNAAYGAQMLLSSRGERPFGTSTLGRPASEIPLVSTPSYVRATCINCY